MDGAESSGAGDGTLVTTLGCCFRSVARAGAVDSWPALRRLRSLRLSSLTLINGCRSAAEPIVSRLQRGLSRRLCWGRETTPFARRSAAVVRRNMNERPITLDKSIEPMVGFVTERW